MEEQDKSKKKVIEIPMINFYEWHKGVFLSDSITVNKEEVIIKDSSGYILHPPQYPHYEKQVDDKKDNSIKEEMSLSIFKFIK